ncbi:MAG: hypothetical protein C4527_04355 [Candidatus Omnitrophota bacterium]|jgi:Flp pilus assembly protein TadG|nr:MAG: hypothetical protein C4527_04355 [Candidatus Omnitrophota bacterium]
MKIRTSDENGSVLPLVAVSMTFMFIMLAMVVDIGWIVNAESELQHAADAAALAAAAKLIDEDALRGISDLSDDFLVARDYAESYVAFNKSARKVLAVDRNEENDVTGGVVIGYIDDPFDLNSPFVTEGISAYNSVQVKTQLTQELNGPLALLIGAIVGVDSVDVKAKATATIEDRIAGFALNEGERLPMLPFTAYDETWYGQIDGINDRDEYTVENGVVTSGADGIPEIRLYMWKNNLESIHIPQIPGQAGNVRTLFVTPSLGVSYNKNQIYNGMSVTDLDAVDGLVLTDDGSGNSTKWLPGEHWMSSEWHTALRNIVGETRILPLFQTLHVGSAPPIALMDEWNELFGECPGSLLFGMPETCCAITQYYEVDEFKAVTVVYSYWSSTTTKCYFTVQPTQITSNQAIVDPNMPGSGTVYALSLTR